jgi:rare lipoprotein A
MGTGRRLAIVLCLTLAGCAGSPPAPVEVAVPVAPPVERGKASFYHGRFHGRLTANGERYDQEALTAAHRTLPFGTVVQVTNLTNGKSIVLRVNDRGPFVQGRVIDVSRRAARELGFLKAGVVDAEVQILERPGG